MLAYLINTIANYSGIIPRIITQQILKVNEMNQIERDGDGYLTDMNYWSPEIGKQMAEADGVELDEAKWQQIIKAREYYDEFSVVPPIRKFAKHIGAVHKTQHRIFQATDLFFDI